MLHSNLNLKADGHRLEINDHGQFHCFLCNCVGWAEEIGVCSAPDSERAEFDDRYTLASDPLPANAKQTIAGMQLPATIHAMLNSRGFQLFIESKLGNDLFISDPDRAERIHDAAEHGCDGSTHAEHIEDWTEYVEQLYSEVERALWSIEDDNERAAAENDLATWSDQITREISKCEAWHAANGSLHEEIG